MTKQRIRAILSVDLGPQTKDRLTKLATRRGLGPSSLAAQIIREYLNEHDPATATAVTGTKPPQSVSPAWEAVVRMTDNEPDFSGAPEIDPGFGMEPVNSGAPEGDSALLPAADFSGAPETKAPLLKAPRLYLDRSALILLRVHAEALGLSPSRTLRYFLSAALQGLPLFSGPELKELVRAGYELSRLAVNLNQLAHHANKLALDEFDREAERRLLQAVREEVEPLGQFTKNYVELLDSLVEMARSRWKAADKVDAPQPEFSVMTENDADSQQGVGA